MPLTAGDKLGPFEILSPLGAGGMGEVYRARDSRLNRDVAIKVLPAAFSDDMDRMARFQREAQMLAALNHPHIAAIYGIEQAAIVMELVEGRDLAGPVPVAEAIAIARQIADALDAAHQKNIIHRDLKPANVKITPEGSVKVLDFGLAKAFDTGPVSADPKNSPTLTMESTRAGVIMGTAGYMSPEQARGKAVDKRADIWSFGVVFYELLTGQRAFEGETVSDTLAAVLRADLDWTRLPESTPAGVRRLLERCLERDPNKRLRDIGDVWGEIDRPSESEAGRPWKLLWILGAVAALAVCAAVWGWLRAPVETPRTVTRSATTVAGFQFPTLSRDGTRLAYMEFAGEHQKLMMRAMNELEGKPVPGGENAFSPMFSPDGQWIAYGAYPAPLKLKKIPVTGGAPITICDLKNGFHGSWGLDDTILFNSTTGLMRVPAAGGTPKSLTTINTNHGETIHFEPELLPGGKAILFGIATGPLPDTARIAVLDLKSGAYRTVVNAGYAARYVPTGHLVYVRGGTLFAAPFDLKALAVTGPETAVVEGIDRGGAYTFSDSSLLVFRTPDRSRDSGTTFALTDRKGVEQPLPEQPHHWGDWAVSPDGKMVAGAIRSDAVGSEPSHEDIWIYDIERGTLARLTFEGQNEFPVWTPDGKWVTYSSRRDGKSAIYRVAADRSGSPELLVTAESEVYGVEAGSWTPDGKTFFYAQATGGKSQIWTLAAPGKGGESKPRVFAPTAFIEGEPQVSPDGKWLAYESNESGKREVYAVPLPGPGGKTQISTQGGDYPKWSRGGRELFYKEPETNQVMAVDMAAGAVLRAGQPKALFKIGRMALFDVMSDGKRFVVERVPERSTTRTYVTITDWFDDLRRRAPVRN